MPTHLFTQEIGPGCNYPAGEHLRCPSRYPDRLRGNLDSSRPVPDDMIVENAVVAWDQGFRGCYGWSYYSEPTIYFDRIEEVQRRIKSRVQGARFLLWTNGLLMGKTIPLERFEVFDAIVYSNYGNEDRQKLIERFNGLNVRVQGARLDHRMQGGPENFAPCGRIDRELVIDYYGNWRLCCGDWEGNGVKLNVHDVGIHAIIEAWREFRGRAMQDPQPTDLPAICRHCTVR